MKKNILLLFIICITFYSCVDEIVVDDTKPSGKIVVVSEPDSAQIFLLGTNTNKVTPDSIINLEAGEYEILLRKTGYLDTTLNITVFKNLPTSVKVILKSLTNSGSIFVESEPQGAQIFLAGLNTNKITPDTIKNIKVGNYDITLKLQDYHDTTFTVSVLKDQIINKNIQLTKVINRGSLFIESEPSGAQIFLNSVNTGKVTPDTLKNLDVGDYDLTLKLSEYRDTTFSITILKDQLTNKNVELTKIINRGNMFVQSQPQGAQIFLEDINTGKFTPDTLNNLVTGNYKLTLKLEDYFDSTFTALIQKNNVTFINILLKEKLPVKVDTLYYNFTIFSQTQFTFSFNQDITLSRVEVIEPDSTAKSTYNFNDEFIQKTSTRTVNYTGTKNGLWKLIFYGNKVTGVKPGFVVERTITIP